MKNKKTEYGVKPYEELDFSDDFMFGKVTQDKELSRNLLKCLLQREVGELENITSQREFRETKDGKPIRMDMYSRDETTIYDSEMMNLNNKTVESLQLPRRTRFYQSSLDKDHLEKKGSYRSLPDSTILFICTFDPFKKGLAKYTFRPKCEEDRDLYLNDGTERLFFNCKYEGDDVPEDIKQFYEYMQTGRSNSELTRQIEEAVGKAKKREEWKSEYMKERVLLMDAREEGREEERKNTERERERADKAEAVIADKDRLLAKYIMTFGEFEEAGNSEEWKSEYMKERVLLMDAREEGREEERVNTERERERADKADKRAEKANKRADIEKHRADKAEERADKAEAVLADKDKLLAKYIMTFGELKD